jgi:endonuclease/exonuclease/phosphatase family metal-dependent hydrolase
MGVYLSTKVYQFPKNQTLEGLKVMTWNVKCFDLYDWNKNENTRKKMLSLIDSVDADILCFQEFYTDTNHFNNLKAIRQLGYPYVHFQTTLVQQRNQKWGVATFSKYPIVRKEIVKIDEAKHNIAICTQIRISDSVYSIYNAHFQSLHFSFEDYDYIEKLKNEYEYDGFKNQLLVSKIFKAYPLRVKQVSKILDHIALSKNSHIVLAVDMNDIPISYCYHQIGRTLQDAFLEKGGGASKTIDLFNPWLRIDYVFCSKNLSANAYSVLYQNLSDHYPVVVYLKK